MYDISCVWVLVISIVAPVCRLMKCPGLRKVMPQPCFEGKLHACVARQPAAEERHHCQRQFSGELTMMLHFCCRCMNAGGVLTVIQAASASSARLTLHALAPVGPYPPCIPCRLYAFLSCLAQPAGAHSSSIPSSTVSMVSVLFC